MHYVCCDLVAEVGIKFCSNELKGLAGGWQPPAQLGDGAGHHRALHGLWGTGGCWTNVQKARMKPGKFCANAMRELG